MRILCLGMNYAPEPIGIAVYTSGLAESLAAMGHEIELVAAKPYYPEWRIADGYRGPRSRTLENGVLVTRCPLYVPARPSGARRIRHHLSFARAALGPMLRAARRFKPEIVLTIAPSLIAAPVARLAARRAGARSWLHVQDFEVEAAFATGLLDAASLGARLARRFERKVMTGFDGVSSISPEMCAKLESFGIPADRIHELRNWAEIDKVRPLDGPSTFRAEWGIRAPHVALYSGNIANKQGVEILVEAARLLKNRADLMFVICGQGPNRAALEASAAGLGNILFRDLQPAGRLGDLLGLATIHLLPQKPAAADLVLPSKLTNMLASGRPVVATAAPGTGLAREIHGCGLATPPEDAPAFAAAIARLIDEPDLNRVLSLAARRRAEEAWSRPAIIGRFEARLRALVED
jgi:colanic acid biosynthesis glycosyl transferase WcaI